MTTLHLSKRTSHKYVGTYQHLDAWEDIPATAELIGEGEAEITDPEDMCEPTRQRLHYLVTCDAMVVDEKDVRKALEDEHSSHGCAHDYDCCGCRSYTALATRLMTELDKQLWQVEIASSRNY
jgi:hypothetical protein